MNRVEDKVGFLIYRWTNIIALLTDIQRSRKETDRVSKTSPDCSCSYLTVILNESMIY